MFDRLFAICHSRASRPGSPKRMTANQKTQAILDELGASPDEIGRDLTKFRKAARALSSRQPRLIDRYEKQWVGVYGGHVRVHGETLESVLSQIDAKGLPREHVIVRFIDKNQKTMIL